MKKQTEMATKPHWTAQLSLGRVLLWGAQLCNILFSWGVAYPQEVTLNRIFYHRGKSASHKARLVSSGANCQARHPPLAKFFTGKVGKCRQEAKVLPGAMVCHCSMNKFDYMHAEGGLWRDWNNQNNGGEKIIPSRSKNLDWSFLGWGRGCKLKLNLNVNGSGFL